MGRRFVLALRFAVRTPATEIASRCDHANNTKGNAPSSRELRQRNGKMLVLSRKKNESIIINNNIRLVVVEIRGDKVRLGVEAPKEVPVHRSEVHSG